MGSHGIALYTGRITLSLTAVGAAVADVPSAGRGEVEAAPPSSSHIRSCQHSALVSHQKFSAGEKVHLCTEQNLLCGHFAPHW